MLRVVFHAPTPEALHRARRNLLNFRIIEPDAALVIIANAGAVGAALETPDTDTDTALLLCQRTLTNAGITNHRQLAETDSAVVEIARRQAEGWQYIRS